MSENLIKWVLFLALLALFPAVFFLFFTVPIWPVLVVLTQIFPSMIVRGDLNLSLAFFVECCIWSGAFYFLSGVVSRKLSAFRSGRRTAYLSMVLLVIYFVAMLPIYDFYLEGMKSNVTAFFFYFNDESFFLI